MGVDRRAAAVLGLAFGAVACAHAPVPAPAASDAALYRATVGAAGACLRAEDAAQARRWLGESPAALRAWEWRHLEARRDGSVASFPAGGGGAFRIAWSPDGRRLALPGEDGVARVVDAETGATLAACGGSKRPLFEAVFSPDGARLVAASEEGTARLFDAATGVAIRTLWTHDTPVSSAAFSPDGRRVAASAYLRLKQAPWVEGVVKVFDAGSGDVVATVTGNRKPLSMVRFSPAGNRLAASSWDGLVLLWEARDGAAPRILELPDEGRYNAADALAWSPDGTLLAAGGKDGTVRLLDAATGTLVSTIRGSGAWVSSVEFDRDGKRLATGGRDGVLRLWSVPGGSPAGVLLGHEGAISGLAFRPDGGRIATTGADGRVLLWDPATPSGPAGPRNLGHAATALAFSPDGALLAFAGAEGGVRLEEGATGRVRLAIAGPSLNAVAFDPSGTLLAGAGGNGHLLLWRVGDGALLHDLPAHGNQAHDVAFSADGARVASGGRDGTLREFDVATGTPLGSHVARKGAVDAVAFGRDGRLFSAGADGTLRASGGAGGEEVLLRELGRVQALRLSPDGDRLLLGDGASRVRVLDLATGAVTFLPGTHPAALHGIEFGPGGDRLFVLSSEVRVLEWPSGDHLATLDGLGDPGWSLAVDPAGVLVVAGAWGGVPVVWSSRR